MSEPLIVKTLFTDISELAQGFVERVGEDQLILAAASKVVEGEWTQFIVLLGDGTPAFAGVGRCIEMADRGEDAAPESRYDLLLDSLRFEEDSQAVFDHLVLVRNDLIGDQEPQEDQNESNGSEAFPIDLNTAELKDFNLDEALDGDLPPPLQATPPEFVPDPGTIAQPTAEADGEDQFDEAESPPEPEQQETADGSVEQEQIPGSILTRPVVARAWQPQADSRPEPRPSSDLFRYNGNGLPFPEKPPRPDLDPSLWVAKAAHPNDPPGASRSAAAVFATASSSSKSVESENWDEASGVAAPVPIDSSEDRGESEQQPEPIEQEAFPDELGTAELIDGELEEIEDE